MTEDEAADIIAELKQQNNQLRYANEILAEEIDRMRSAFDDIETTARKYA
jgi:cell division protein FtsB